MSNLDYKEFIAFYETVENPGIDKDRAYFVASTAADMFPAKFELAKKGELTLEDLDDPEINAVLPISRKQQILNLQPLIKNFYSSQRNSVEDDVVSTEGKV